jgi:DNA-binding transcriptional MerR regulator
VTLVDPAPAAPSAATVEPQSETPSAGYSIAEVAERVGVTAHTLRYYERIGLLAVDRDAGGRRVYREHDVARLTFITRLRSTNLPIGAVQRYFELADAGPHTEPDRLALLERHRDNVRRQLAEIQEALAVIEFKIELYGGSLETCST